MLAMREARAFGTEVDERIFEEQAEFTLDFFKSRAESVREGKAVGGRAMTAAYALWTLDIGGRERDKTSDALVSYLLKRQEKDGRWKVQTHRPPLEQSNIMTSFLAAYYTEQFANDEQKASVKKASDRAKAWILAKPLNSQEDRNARLWALSEFGLDGKKQAVEAILTAQKSDGGWSQVDDMPSDAYATGQTLYILSHVNALPSDHPAVLRAVDYLLKSQEADGSWFVKTRIKPIQRFFDNGDPHGKNQFISMSATGWAVAALASIHKKTNP